ncbi:MAG: nicotinate phosphoribosyltransferase [Coriobacteriia bacterium]|nr:nicotinate phosphoribosyltransferase [Coriobacteriia bacterium]
MHFSETLLTDLYQLTQAQAYFINGKSELEGSFYMHFRSNPFSGGYTVACGMQQIVDFIESFAFSDDDIDYLRSLRTASGGAMFNNDFLTYLAQMHLEVDVDAVLEGSLIFPYEPIVRVTGSMLQAQIIETPLLNQVGYQTLIATRAARICEVAEGPVAEFGLRRAQGPAGGIFASRAAIIGGCSSTSNVEAGRLFGLPVSGTHAHSWVMAFDSELEAFRAFAQAQPDGCILLVDTYDTIHGVENAIVVGKEMKQRGQELFGIRIDSGDLAWLSIRARSMLDEAGLGYVKIVGSNDLDEYTIKSLHDQGARFDMWGVGTRLATAYETPALAAVYKLSAYRNDANSEWIPTFKATEQLEKSTLPGVLDVRRYYGEDGLIAGDMIYQLDSDVTDEMIVDPHDEMRQKRLIPGSFETLLKPLARKGKIVWKQVSVAECQAHCQASLQTLDPTSRRFMNPHRYPVGLEPTLHELRNDLRRKAKGL